MTSKTRKGDVRLVALLLLLVWLASGCVFMVAPPQPSTYPGWCYSLSTGDLEMASAPGQVGLWIDEGLITSEGTFISENGLMQMIYTHNQLVEVEYVAAEIDITNTLDDPTNVWIDLFPNDMVVAGGINIFGFQETFNETVRGYANNLVVSAYNNPVNGVLGTTQAIISLAVPVEGVIEIKRLMLFGKSNTNGQVVSPFDRDDCLEPTPTISPTPDPTNVVTPTQAPTSTNTPITLTPTPTSTELPSWCYRFDFAIDSFGWTAVDSSATYQSGLGWNTVGDGYLDSAFIGLSFDNTTINGVTMIVSETLYSGGQFYVGSSPNNHEYTISPRSTQWDLRNINIQTGYVSVGLDSQIGSILDWYGYLTLVELYGSGLNPFGMDNCSPFTPTPTATQSPTPTGTQYPTITPSPSLSPTITNTPTPSPTIDCARFWWSCYTPSPDQTIVYTPTRYPTQTPYPTRTPYTALPTYTPLATYTSVVDGGIYQATQNARSTFVPVTGTASAIANATAQARQGNEDAFIQSQNWWAGGGNWTGRFNNAMGSFGSSMSDSMAWVDYGGETTSSVVTAWNSATPTPINGLPRCQTNPRGHQLCAVYYILENTLFEGAGGIAILVALQTLIYIAIVMKIASFVGTVIDFIRGLTKIGG